jgi:MFS family permease
MMSLTLLNDLTTVECLSPDNPEWILACNYKDALFPILIIILLIIMLPIPICYFLNIPVQIAWVLVYLYWILFAFGVQRLYFKIKKIPKTKFLDKKKEDVVLMTDLGVFMLFVFLFMTYFNSFFYYPKTIIEIKFDHYILIASLLVVLITFYYTTNKDGKISKINDRSIKFITIISLLLILVGAFFSFSSASRAAKETDIVNLASFNAFQSAFFLAGFYGVFIAFLIITMLLLPKKKKETVIYYEEADDFF